MMTGPRDKSHEQFFKKAKLSEPTEPRFEPHGSQQPWVFGSEAGSGMRENHEGQTLSQTLPSAWFGKGRMVFSVISRFQYSSFIWTYLALSCSNCDAIGFSRLVCAIHTCVSSMGTIVPLTTEFQCEMLTLFSCSSELYRIFSIYSCRAMITCTYARHMP